MPIDATRATPRQPRLKKSLRRVLPYAALWMLAFAVRAIVLGDLQHSPFGRVLMGDAQQYDAWARRILAGDWWGDEVFYQAPLYPYFMAAVYALFGPVPLAVRAVQIALAATACVFVACAGRRLYSPAAGWVAGGLLAIYPPAVFFDVIVQKTALAACLWCVLVWQLALRVRRPSRSGGWLCTGLTLGFLALVRENALVLAAVLPLWAAALRPGARRWCVWTGWLWLGTAAVLLPVAVRNRIVGGEWHLTTAQFGPNFYIGNSRHADGLYLPLRPDRAHPRFEREDATALAEAAVGRSLSAREISRYWTGRTLDEIAADPRGWLRLLGTKALLTLNAVELGDTEDPHTLAEYSPLLSVLFAAFDFGVLLALGAAGLCLTARVPRREGLLLALFAAYAATVVLFYVFGRYRHPLALLLVLPAGAGLVRVTTLLRRRRWFRLAIAAAIGAASAVVARWPLVDGDVERANTRYNLAVHLAAVGAPDHDVLSHARRGVALNPADGRVERFQARYLYERGEAAAAVPHFQRAVQLLSETDAELPALSRLHHDLGRALVRSGRLDEAVSAFEQAVALDPGFVPPRLVLVGLLERAGRRNEAAAQARDALRRLPADSENAARLRRILRRDAVGK